MGGELSLRDAAEGLAREYGRAGAPGQPSPAIRIDVAEDAATALPPARRAEVVQMLREALSNASRHAQASEIAVTARLDRGRLVLRVEDDGIGFDPSEARENGHHGLRNMANRARQLDGRLDVQSRPGEGTRVELSVPLEASAR